jgi:hypothetical protein
MEGDFLMDYEKMYNNKTIAVIREQLEKEFRNQYNVACNNSHLFWQGKFKKAFENIVESLVDLDQLLR